MVYNYEIEQYIQIAKQARYSLFLTLEQEWKQGEIWGCQDNWDIYEELTNDITYLETILADGVDGECATDAGYEEVISHINKNAALAELCDGISFNGIFDSSGGGTNPPTPPSDDCCQFNGQRAITSLPQIGDNYDTTTVKDFLEAAYFTAAPPSASISGGNTRERGSSTAVTLNWTATRGGNAITGITVNGTIISPTGNTQSGTQSASADQDQTTTFIMSCTDGTTIASANTTVYWAYKRFYGTPSSIPINSTQVRALSGSTFNNTFSISIAAGQRVIVFAYPATIADITYDSVKYVEGFNSPVGSTFSKTTFNVNDAGGNPISYKVWSATLPVAYGAAATYNVTLP